MNNRMNQPIVKTFKKNIQKKAFLNPKNILIFTPQNFFRYLKEKQIS